MLRSSPSAISSLPPECLLSVFTYVVEQECPRGPVNGTVLSLLKSRSNNAWKNEPEWLGGQPGTLGWIRLGHVSHGWRTTILNCTKFWADNIGILPLGFTAMLERAGPTQPLTLCSYSSEFRQGPKEMHDMLLADNGVLASRTCRLEVVEVHGTSFSKRVLLQCAFPNLHSLLFCAQSSGVWTESGDNISFDAPNLQTAELTDMFLVYNSTSLQKLSVSQSWLSIEDIMSATHTSQHSITFLELDDCMPLVDDDDEDNPTKLIYFPNLKVLRVCMAITGDLHSIVPLLEYIKIPETALCSLKAKGVGDQNILTFYLRNIIEALGAPVIEGASITKTQDQFVMRFYDDCNAVISARTPTSDLIPNAFFSLAHKRLELVLKPNKSLINNREFENIVLKSFAPGQISALSLDWKGISGFLALHTEVLTGVRSLHIHDLGASPAKILRDICVPQGGAGEMPSKLPLPQLSNLLLEYSPRDKIPHKSALKQIQARGVVVRVFHHDRQNGRDVLTEKEL